MDSTSSGNPFQSLLGLLNNIWGYVTVILTLILAIRGIQGLYPITTAILTALVLSVFFCSWRWTHITKTLQLKEDVAILVDGKQPEPQKPSLWGKLLDINRKYSTQLYTMPVSRRRTEIGILAIAVLVVIAFALDQYKGAYVELGGLDCPRAEPDSIRILVANFDNPDSKNNYFENRLGEKLSEQVPESSVCRYKEIIEGPLSEIDFGAYQPSVVVKGGTSNDVLHITIIVIEWFEQREEFSILPEDIKEFENVGIYQIPYLSSFIVSESLFVDGQIKESREILQAALEDAEGREWVENNLESLANGYLLLADIHTFISVEAGFSRKDLLLAIDNYTRALERNPDLDIALLNRGFAYQGIGEYEKALQDFELLLTKESLNDSDKAAIYTNRGSIMLELEDYLGAIADFHSALELTDPEGDPYIFYDLGVAYLLAGEFSTAQETFVNSIPYLDAFLRDDFIYGLKEVIASNYPHLRQEIDVIVQILLEAGI